MTISEICGLPFHGRIPHAFHVNHLGSGVAWSKHAEKKAGLNFTHFQRGWFSGEIEDTMWFLYVVVCSSVVLFLSFSLYVFICVFIIQKYGVPEGLTAWQADTLVALRSRLGNTCPMAKHGQTMFCFGILRYSSGKYKQYIYNQYLCLDHSTYDNPRNQTVNLIAGPSSRGSCCQLQFWGALAQRASGKLRPQVVTLKWQCVKTLYPWWTSK